MSSSDEPDIVIVSDLHMSSGYNRRTGTYDRNEDFFMTARLAALLITLFTAPKQSSVGGGW